MKLTITIRNETEWRGDDLRRIFRAGLRAAGASGRREIQVRHHGLSTSTRTLHTRGRGEYGTPWGDGYLEGLGIQMWVPRPSAVWWPGQTDAERGDREREIVRVISRVFEHEAMHNLGMTHREMARDLRACGQPVPWSGGLQLRRKGGAAKSAAGDTGRSGPLSADPGT